MTRCLGGPEHGADCHHCHRFGRSPGVVVPALNKRGDRRHERLLWRHHRSAAIADNLATERKQVYIDLLVHMRHEHRWFATYAPDKLGTSTTPFTTDEQFRLEERVALWSAM